MIALTNQELKSIILSHGWYSLNPFKVTLAPPSVHVAFDLPIGAGAFKVGSNGLSVELLVEVGSFKQCQKVAEICLSLNIDPLLRYGEDLTIGEKYPWLFEKQIGRFLKSPSLYEDCCKVILTTNTTWSRTKNMIKRLVDELGMVINGHKAFPSPIRILELDEENLKEVARCGFRAKFLMALAEAAMEEKDFFLDTGWAECPSGEFYKKLLNIKGIGEDSANYISLIYWRQNDFVIDSYVKRRCKELWNVEGVDLYPFLKDRCKDYEDLAPLLLWFEITRYWQDDIESNEPKVLIS